MGCLGYMLDKSTLVAYTCNDEVYEYGNVFKYKNNSKQWRQLIHMDSNNCGTIIFSRQYPFASQIIAPAIRELLEAQVCNTLKLDNSWKISYGSLDSNTKLNFGAYGYNDLENSGEFKVAQLKNTEENLKSIFNVSVANIKCINSNNNLNSSDDIVLDVFEFNKQLKNNDCTTEEKTVSNEQVVVSTASSYFTIPNIIYEQMLEEVSEPTPPIVNESLIPRSAFLEGVASLRGVRHGTSRIYKK
jgi:hypothetical protein